MIEHDDGDHLSRCSAVTQPGKRRTWNHVRQPCCACWLTHQVHVPRKPQTRKTGGESATACTQSTYADIRGRRRHEVCQEGLQMSCHGGRVQVLQSKWGWTRHSTHSERAPHGSQVSRQPTDNRQTTYTSHHTRVKRDTRHQTTAVKRLLTRHLTSRGALCKPSRTTCPCRARRASASASRQGRHAPMGRLPTSKCTRWPVVRAT